MALFLVLSTIYIVLSTMQMGKTINFAPNSINNN